MTQTVFLRLDTLLARASKTGINLPSVTLTLCSAERIELACVDEEDVVGPLTGDVNMVQVCVKKSPDDEESLLLLTDCPAEGEGTAARYIAEWSDADMDNDELRAILGKNIIVAGDADSGPWMEVAVTRDGKTDRFSFPITLRNAFLRPETAGPNPRANTSWEWFKARLQVAGSSISRVIDDALQTLTLSVSMAWGDISGKPSTFPPSSHSHTISDVTGLETALAAKAASSLIGANNGIAPLDSGGKVPAANLPSYVDDVIESANFAGLPGSGETGKIYVTIDTGKTYRWSGSAYVEISGVPAFASQAEAEAGTDNTKIMTPQRTAQAIAALGGGGGGANGMADFAFVNASTGNNSTAVLGDPSKPYATISAAYLAALQTGVAKIFLQTASTDGLNVTNEPTIELHLHGMHHAITTIPGLIFFGCETIRIVGNGRGKINIGTVTVGFDDAQNGDGGTLQVGGDASAGTNYGDVSIVGVTIESLICQSQNGGSGGKGDDNTEGTVNGYDGWNGGAGGDGAGGGPVILRDCYLGAGGEFQTNGGNGGSGGDGGMPYSDGETTGTQGTAGTNGNGGTGGTMTFYHCTPLSTSSGVQPVSCGGGLGGGLGSGAPGTSGIEGELNLYWSEISSVTAVNHGTVRMSFYAGSFLADGSLV